MHRTSKPDSFASSAELCGRSSACNRLSTLRRAGWLIALVMFVVRALRLIFLPSRRSRDAVCFISARQHTSFFP